MPGLCCIKLILRQLFFPWDQTPRVQNFSHGNQCGGEGEAGGGGDGAETFVILQSKTEEGCSRHLGLIHYEGISFWLRSCVQDQRCARVLLDIASHQRMMPQATYLASTLEPRSYLVWSKHSIISDDGLHLWSCSPEGRQGNYSIRISNDYFPDWRHTLCIRGQFYHSHLAWNLLQL